MSNVKPQEGQVWEKKEFNHQRVLIEKISAMMVVDGFVMIPIGRFVNEFKFIPQNDLEWLAVNETEWDNDDRYPFIVKLANGANYSNSDFDCDIERHTREQWQSMRYQLGLDDKPHIEYETDEAKIKEMMDYIDINMTIKETKMIDLSKAAVGDKFMTSGSKVTLITKGNYTYCLEYEDGSLMLTDSEGTIAHSGSPLVSKVDPRHWLKDLPSADLFDANAIEIKCYESGEWLFTSCEECECRPWSYIQGFKMPTLTGDEWKQSKISIADLRAWQEQSK